MLTEQSATETPTAARNPWIEPFAQSLILAGFLRPEDVPIVYPASRGWPEEVYARLLPLYGAGAGVSPRPSAGRCRLHPVEEPEALAVLHQMTQAFQVRAESPVSYAWVEIENLIASLSVSAPLPQQVIPFTKDPGHLAEYSLYGPPVVPVLGEGGSVYTLSAAAPVLVHQDIDDGLLVCRYQFARVPQPIIVGYEEGRFYLLTEYARVLQAMVGKVDRLLCLIHYGLDLGAAKVGLRGLEPPGGVANHFGRAVLSGDRPPMVKDFLDPSLAAAVPSRAAFYLIRLSAHTTPLNFTLLSPVDRLPLGSSAN